MVCGLAVIMLLFEVNFPFFVIKSRLFDCPPVNECRQAHLPTMKRGIAQM